MTTHQQPHLRAQQRYYAARDRYEHEDRVAKEAYRAMKKAEQELVTAMQDAGVKSFALEDGTNVILKAHTSVAVNQKNMDFVRKFINKRGWDAETMSKTSLDKSAVMDKVKEQLDIGALQEFDIPPEMDFKRHASVDVRGWKNRVKGREL